MRIAVAATTSLLVLGLAACSSGGGGTKTASSKSATPSTSAVAIGTVSLPGQPGPLVDMIGRQMKAARTMHAQVRVASADGSTQVEQLAADLRTDTASPMAALTLHEPSQPTTYAVVTNGIIYSKVDGQEQEPGKPWAKLSRDDLRNLGTGPAAKLLETILDQTDSALREVTADTGLALVRNGNFRGAPVTETVNGVQAHRYQGTTKTEAMVSTDSSYRQMAGAGLDKLAWTLWVDDRGLPARFVVTLAAKDNTQAVHTADYTGWGKPVTIAIPSPDKVASVTG
jgi:hypothetical protein